MNEETGTQPNLSSIKKQKQKTGMDEDRQCNATKQHAQNTSMSMYSEQSTSMSHGILEPVAELEYQPPFDLL